MLGFPMGTSLALPAGFSPAQERPPSAQSRSVVCFFMAFNITVCVFFAIAVEPQQRQHAGLEIGYGHLIILTSSVEHLIGCHA
jgi:hypothetical protein